MGIKSKLMVVAEVGNEQSATTTVHEPFTLENGQHQIEILYWDQGFDVVLHVQLVISDINDNIDRIGERKNGLKRFQLQHKKWIVVKAQFYLRRNRLGLSESR